MWAGHFCTFLVRGRGRAVLKDTLLAVLDQLEEAAALRWQRWQVFFFIKKKTCFYFSKEYFDVERRQERSVEETTTPRRWHKRTQLERRLGVFQSLTRNQFIFFISKQKHFLSSLKFLILFQSVFLLWLQKCGGTRTHTHTAPMEDCKNIRPKKKIWKKKVLCWYLRGVFSQKKYQKRGFFSSKTVYVSYQNYSKPKKWLACIFWMSEPKKITPSAFWSCDYALKPIFQKLFFLGKSFFFHKKKNLLLFF